MIGGFSHLVRLGRAGFVFAREDVFALVDTRPLPLPARMAIAVARLFARPSAKGGASRLAAALTRLGPTYVKLGQFLATRPDVVGNAIAHDLESLQDKMAPFPQSEAEARIAAALDKPLNEIYVSFGPSVAAASIAQVHHAEVDEDGARKAVAVKILRPDIERRFKADLDAFYYVARKAENWSLEAQRLRLIEVVATLARSVAIE
ncbi:MAG TPA: AarF/UbiB family protein, partial [Pseudolabrys sp.]|nr:AarF/UbiB family protein [Pseudolabrys sp.]